MGKSSHFPGNFRDLFTLTPNLGGLGITSPKSESPQQYSNSVLLTKCESPQQYSNSVLLTKCESPQQYSNSVLLTKSHVEAIKHQSTEFTNDETEAESAKKQIRLGKGELLKAKVQRIDAELEAKTKRMVDQARDTGASSWLNAIPLKEQGLCLNKEEFRDAVRLRYDMPLKGLPSHCVCGERFSVSHAQSCKKGGFIARRHDGIRDLLRTLVSKVCKKVQSEPHLIPVENEVFELRSANTSSEARLDLKAGSFWSRGVTAFFDVREQKQIHRTNLPSP